MTWSALSLSFWSFLDPANAGVLDVSPASVTNGVSAVTSSGNPATDLVELISAFEGDLDKAYLISDPVTIAEMALSRDAGGSFAFPDLGVRGGSVLGIPVLVSRGSPRATAGGILVLLDPGAIAFGDGEIRLERASHASLQMLDNPTNDASDGTPATSMVSMWQTNSHAIRAERTINWMVARDGAVSVVSDALYPTT